MRKKKADVLKSIAIWEDSSIKIYKENEQYCFEIDDIITYDISEAVAIISRIKGKNNSTIWDIPIDFSMINNVSPENTIYWLSGGIEEWKENTNYTKSWVECLKIFEEKFGNLILKIVSNSKSLKEIRNEFNRLLSLPILYEFSIENNII